MQNADIELRRDGYRAFPDGREVKLTRIEYRLLEAFLDDRGVVRSRPQLLQAAWDTKARIETRTVDMHVARLRAKLGPAGSLIETVRGVGYRFKTGVDSAR